MKQATRPDLEAVCDTAHNLNDELTIILNTAEMLLARLRPFDPNRQELLDLEHAVWRCSLWSRLLARYLQP